MTLSIPSIEWTDSVIGEALLPCGTHTFKDWTPDVIDVGDAQVAVGSAVTYFFAYRDPDHVATLSLTNIPNYALHLAMALKSHLTRGGVATINTADSEDRQYAVRLQPGTVPALAYADSTAMESTLTIQVMSTEGVPLLYTPFVPTRTQGGILLNPGALVSLTVGTNGTVQATLGDERGFPLFNVDLTATSGDTDIFTLGGSEATSGDTDLFGNVVFTLHPVAAGEATLTVESDEVSATVSVVVT